MKELIKSTSKNSFEINQYANVDDAVKKYKDEVIDIILWEENENEYKHFKQLKKKFNGAITILISNGKIETIIDEINRDGLFRIATSGYKVSDLVKYLEEALHKWQDLQNQKKKITGNDKETLQKELLIAQEIQKNLLPTATRCLLMRVLSFCIP